MILRYHPLVQRDVSVILAYYEDISVQVADGFWDELMTAIQSIQGNPTHHHFDASGLRRCNLHRFPYHILFRITGGLIRVLTVRHHHRHPRHGTRRR